ncbi:hypothetical protein IL38_24225 [Actinopolyspora erythraea]|uniref:Uncharacterized protein n=1 Tax=Actinopolyspora erythraea TaxID=414996 RepID=A0ABR4WYJ8_9ACTN|nr:hypothetical protein [Actinopolyspora erythraea]KGI79403.1 hypothetical protein IL38_24225 [Actinopolyspora erythraea]
MFTIGDAVTVTTDDETHPALVVADQADETTVEVEITDGARAGEPLSVPTTAVTSGVAVIYTPRYGDPVPARKIKEHRNHDGRFNGIARIDITSGRNKRRVDCGVINLSQP